MPSILKTIRIIAIVLVILTIPMYIPSEESELDLTLAMALIDVVLLVIIAAITMVIMPEEKRVKKPTAKEIIARNMNAVKRDN
jgi:hypothetical protein